jgi:hypothetical protein
VPANNFSQTTPNAIANDRTAEPARSNEPCTPWTRIPHRHHIQDQAFAVMRGAVPFHTLVLQAMRQATRF